LLQRDSSHDDTDFAVAADSLADHLRIIDAALPTATEATDTIRTIHTVGAGTERVFAAAITLGEAAQARRDAVTLLVRF